MKTIVLDNEAVQALEDARHARHRAVLAHVVGVAQRRRKGASLRVVVPTSVRVEAGWNRTSPGSSLLNRLRVVDLPLDASSANLAASIVSITGVSVADAHLGAAMRAIDDGDVVVLTSDPGDMVRVAAPRRITAVRV